MPNISTFIKRFGEEKAKSEFNKWYQEYRTRNLEKNREYNREYNKNWRAMFGPEEYQREWRAKNPEKYQAQRKLQWAIKKGKIKKPKFCENCPRSVGLVGHHSDYSLPFLVVWLCHACHRAVHYGNNKNRWIIEKEGNKKWQEFRN